MGNTSFKMRIFLLRSIMIILAIVIFYLSSFRGLFREASIAELSQPYKVFSLEGKFSLDYPNWEKIDISSNTENIMPEIAEKMSILLCIIDDKGVAFSISEIRLHDKTSGMSYEEIYKKLEEQTNDEIMKKKGIIDYSVVRTEIVGRESSGEVKIVTPNGEFIAISKSIILREGEKYIIYLFAINVPIQIINDYRKITERIFKSIKY